jgi:hypothetical protein|tara:strand:+ start:853 stop:3306 length:2454 start_codon:yes stop_codon:yes gene_type:complete
MKQLGAKMHNPKLITKVSAFAMIALVITLVIVGVGIPDPAEPTDGLATVDSISVTNQNTSPSDLVAQYCVVCHNEYLNTGGLALDGFDVNSVQDNPDIWEKVLRKLRANAMPPTGMPRPDEASFSQFESYLSDSLDTLALNSPNPGRTATFSRLSRLQYENAIRDLLVLEVDVSELLPKDDASFGFDNVNLTNLSPALMERYLAAAQKISRLAVGSPLNSPATHVERITANLTQEDRLEGLPFGTRGGTTFIYQFPRDGDYRLDVLLARDRNENIEGLTETHEMEVAIDGAQIKVFEISPNRSERFAKFYYSDRGAGTGLVTNVSVPAGPHEVTVTFLRKNSALLESTRQPYIAHFNRDRTPRQQPAVHSVSIAGPFESRGVSQTPSRERIFSCVPDESIDTMECATSIISSIAQKAFRRPVVENDISIPLEFFERENSESGFEAGIEMAIRAILVSPAFLFRIEQDPADFASGTVYALNDVELASRLSFFLWSTIPDKELMNLAINGQLSEPKVLEAQVARMLKDPKAVSLAADFANQWLYLRNLDGVEPNTRLFPNFDDNLRRSMQQETELLFGNIISEDRNVMELLSANYTFLNERLARHYDIPNVYGDHFRKVTLPEESPRVGLLGHGSILTVTSYATRTSPVMRGKWVLDNVLGIPPPPPPDDIPALPENQSEVIVLTMRERMAQHRANPACAQCHQVMDPIGLVFENFDAIGRARVVNSDQPAIDTKGNLPGGKPLVGVNGLRTDLLNNPNAFVGTMSEKLMTYALGRGLEYYDAPAIRKVLEHAAKEDYRFSALVVAIVNSTPFQMRSTL